MKNATQGKLKTAVKLAVCWLAASTALNPASAREACGWFVIAYCSPAHDAAAHFANNGWGAVIDTSHFRGFTGGQFCVVSGPQSKASARSDLASAKSSGVAAGAYMKRACADEKYLGD